MKDVMPARMSGMAMTAVNFFVMLGAATYLHVMGWMLDRTALPGGAQTAAGYQGAFLLAGGSVAVAFLLYLLTRDARSAGPAPGRRCGGTRPPGPVCRSASRDVRAQCVTASGTAAWASDGVPVCTAAESFRPRVGLDRRAPHENGASRGGFHA